MASDINKVIIIGRLARDPELRYTPNGTAVASFPLACNYTYGSGDNKKEQVSYFDCVVWSKLGEIMTEYCKKGHRIAVEGRLSQRRWDDQDGNKRSKIEIVVESFQFLTGKTQGDEQPTQSNTPVGTTGNAPSNPLDGEDVTGKVDNPFADNPFDDNDIAF